MDILRKFLFFILIIVTGMMFLTGCGSGGNSAQTLSSDGIPFADIVIPFESIELVSPVESGAINAVVDYPQKILVQGVDIYGNRKLLTVQDGLKFSLQNPWSATISESGVLLGALPSTNMLTISLNNQLFIKNIPVNIKKVVLTTISIYANESNVTPMMIPNNYHVGIGAKGVFSDGQTRDISNYTDLWSSENPNIAFESDTIFGPAVFGNLAGKTKIIAKSNTIESNLDVNVIEATLMKIYISPNKKIIPLKKTLNMRAIGEFIYSKGTLYWDVTNNVQWGIESTEIAHINDATGELTTESMVGNIIVTAKSIKGMVAKAHLKVSPPLVESVFISVESGGVFIESNINIVQGNSKNIYPYAKDSDGKIFQLNLNNSTPFCKLSRGKSVDGGEILLDDSQGTFGTITASSVGHSSVILSCSIDNNIIESKVKITISPKSIESLDIIPVGDIALKVGESSQLTAIAHYSDGSDKPVKAAWNSMESNIVSVNESGLITARHASESMITINAIVHDNVTKKDFKQIKKVKVITVSLINIIVAAESPVLISGTTTKITATGVYSDGSRADITGSVIWNCIGPVKCESGMLTAESVTKNVDTTISAKSLDSKIHSEPVQITVKPVKLVELFFIEAQYYHCYTSPVGRPAVNCYVGFLAKYNNSNTLVSYNYTKDNFPDGANSFKINPTGYNLIPPESGVSVYFYYDNMPANKKDGITVKVQVGNVSAHKTYPIED